MDERKQAMKTIDTLRDEHNGVLYVLDQLERAVSAAERGVPLPADVFVDIQEFFAIFVDKCHHGKEEAELFPRLTSADGRALVERLEAEHVTGRRLAAAYASATEAYQPGVAASGTRLAETARAYAAFLRSHIAVETEQLFPVVETLVEQDQDLVDAFERVEEEQIGPGTHERLHGMIDGLGGRIEPWSPATR
jgi:hemerythrin-like domain-containing protein